VTLSTDCARQVVSVFTDNPSKRPEPDCVSDAVIPD
jgi:hypothetical protein